MSARWCLFLRMHSCQRIFTQVEFSVLGVWKPSCFTWTSLTQTKGYSIWCALSVHVVIWSYLFENERGINATTVTSARWVAVLETFVAERLEKPSGSWQTVVSARWSHSSYRQTIDGIFGNRVISRFGNIHCPPKSMVTEFFGAWFFLVGPS